MCETCRAHAGRCYFFSNMLAPRFRWWSTVLAYCDVHLPLLIATTSYWASARNMARHMLCGHVGFVNQVRRFLRVSKRASCWWWSLKLGYPQMCWFIIIFQIQFVIFGVFIFCYTPILYYLLHYIAVLIFISSILRSFLRFCGFGFWFLWLLISWFFSGLCLLGYCGMSFSFVFGASVVCTLSAFVALPLVSWPL